MGIIKIFVDKRGERHYKSPPQAAHCLVTLLHIMLFNIRDVDSESSRYLELGSRESEKIAFQFSTPDSLEMSYFYVKNLGNVKFCKNILRIKLLTNLNYVYSIVTYLGKLYVYNF